MALAAGRRTYVDLERFADIIYHFINKAKSNYAYLKESISWKLTSGWGNYFPHLKISL